MGAEPEGPSVDLDLWHPRGVPRRRLAIGAASRTCDLGPSDDRGPVDVVVVAPATGESAAGWFDRSLADAASRVVDDGIVWVVASRRWRRVARRAARRAGLSIERELILVPPWPNADHFVEFATGPARDASARHLGLGRVRARVVGALAGRRGGRGLIRQMVPGHAFVAVRRPSTVTMAWLNGGNARLHAGATLSRPGESGSRLALVLQYPEKSHRPTRAVKVAFDDAGSERVRRERDALVEFGVAAARAGASVPAVARAECHRFALETSIVPGRPVVTLLTRDPGRLNELTARLVEWLVQWNRLTATSVPATGARFGERLVTRLDRVVAADKSLTRYCDEVVGLATRLAGSELTTVATHNDLTTANVLAHNGRISVVDWEAAGTGLPGMDLWYALTDAVMIAGRVDRATAVRAVVRRTAPATRRVVDAPARLRATLGLSDEEACIAFHACWVHHAANEVDRQIVDGPFLAVVRAIANEGMLRVGDAAPEDGTCES